MNVLAKPRYKAVRYKSGPLQAQTQTWRPSKRGEVTKVPTVRIAAHRGYQVSQGCYEYPVEY